MTSASATPTARRFDSLADAFLHTSTSDALIFEHGYWARRTADTPIHFKRTDIYVVPVSRTSVEWAEKIGMRMVDDFSDLM